jgi:hypothetical protein
MIVVIPQLICCFISTKTEIRAIAARPGARVPRRACARPPRPPQTTSSGYQPCDALGDYTSGATAVPSFAGISVDGLTVTSNASEVAAVPAGSA